ncbi:MAG: hypothetical protein ABR583_04610 [Gaiellaceae bacterium]
MSLPLRALVGLVVLVATVTAAFLLGSGGDERLSRKEYERVVQTSYAEVRATFRQASEASSLPDLAANLAGPQAALRAAARELDETEPPLDAAAANVALVRGLRGYADELTRVRRAAERGDGAFVQRFNEGVAELPSLRQLTRAFEQLRERGYDLGDIPVE